MTVFCPFTFRLERYVQALAGEVSPQIAYNKCVAVKDGYAD